MPTGYLCRDGCWIMWPYHVIECISACVHAWAFCLRTLSASACIHALSHPYMGWISFQKSFLWRLVSVLFLVKKFFTNHVIVTLCRPRTCGWCVIRARVHCRMASTSVFPARKRKRWVPVILKTKLKRLIPREIRTIIGCFERYTYRVTALPL